MRHSTILLTTVAVCTVPIAGGAHKKDQTPQKTLALATRIVGGVNASIDEYPYLVAVKIRDRQYCGGSIISNRVVLTAAHCFRYDNNPRHYSIQYGQTNLGNTKNIIPVRSFMKHPNYSPKTLDYDVALIFLVKYITLGPKAQIIKLALNRPISGSRVSIAGWGATQYGSSGSTNLLSVYLYVLTPRECAKRYRNIYRITPRMICAGAHVEGRDSCSGDSGGPLVLRGVQVGICSNGAECGHKKYPGVYCNVAAVRNWIEMNMEPVWKG
ncbi:trypsin alpha-3-like [Ceratitis capitata]|uniref:trypsin alpha-3-like n=1 Tax=Ceratitis capitata TaxID=7213 RepID=UPI000329EAE3|nr:trypsin alpha-3-like [Ceratitis capitata]